MPRFDRRDVVQLGRPEMALPVGCPEAAVGERLERLGQPQPYEAFPIELLQRNPVYERMRRIEQRPDHVVFRLPETRIVESHPKRDRAEDLDVRLRLAGWRKRGTGELQVIVTVREVQVGAL